MSSKEKQRKLFRLMCKHLASRRSFKARIEDVCELAWKRELYRDKHTARKGVKRILKKTEYPVVKADVGMFKRTDLKN